LGLSEPAAPMLEPVLGPWLAAGAVADVSAVVPVLACCAIAMRSRGEAFRYASSWAYGIGCSGAAYMPRLPRSFLAMRL
jgi:hypothetical protein